MRPENWKVTFAPPPDDIYFENLSVRRKYLNLKVVASNVILFFVAFFLTTPEYLASQTDWIVAVFGETFRLPPPIIGTDPSSAETICGGSGNFFY